MALYVVTGPPAGGKTTWVRRHAQPGDVVVDLDAIASALTVGSPDHQHGAAVLHCARRAWRTAVDEALTRSGDTDVYVVHTMPSPQVMARYERHGAQMVTCDPGREVVDARIRAERPPEARAVAGRWYAQAHDTTIGVTHGDDDQAKLINSRSW